MANMANEKSQMENCPFAICQLSFFIPVVGLREPSSVVGRRSAQKRRLLSVTAGTASAKGYVDLNEEA